MESWRAIQDWSLTHRARGRAVIYLHHHGRSGNPRGTSAREIVLDARIKLVRDAELTTETETAFKLEFPKAREFLLTRHRCSPIYRPNRALSNGGARA